VCRTLATLGGVVVGASLLVACASGGGQESNQSEGPVLPDDERSALLALSPDSLPAPPPDIANTWADDAGAARFGQKLFFDPGFSGELLDGDNDGGPHALGKAGETGKVACAGCHIPTTAYSDTRTLGEQVSLAAAWGVRRAPSLLDVGQSKLLMWDGRKDDLYGQPMGVIENPVEMNSSRLFAAYHVAATYTDEYEALFGLLPPFDDTSRFPPLSATQTGCQTLSSAMKCAGAARGAPGDGAEYDGLAPADQAAVTRVVANVGKALGAYERLIACGPSRFDQWIHGDASALTDSEQRGAALFVGKAQCNTCHSGPFMSDEQFHNVGLQPGTVAVVFVDSNDPGASQGFQELMADPLNVQGQFSDGNDGRDPTTISPALTGAFRTPKLRCVSQRPSFMHTAQFASLDDVVAFFDRGGDAFGYPGKSEISALDLTDQERADLVAFLGALTGPGPDPSLLEQPN